MRERTSASHACGSTPFIFAVTIRLYMSAARRYGASVSGTSRSVPLWGVAAAVEVIEQGGARPSAFLAVQRFGCSPPLQPMSPTATIAAVPARVANGRIRFPMPPHPGAARPLKSFEIRHLARCTWFDKCPGRGATHLFDLRHAEWAEFDLAKRVWVIPASRTKMRREHTCALPTQAIAILKALQPITGQGTLVFPGLRSAHRPISENTMNATLRRLGFAKSEMTSHGFRASASTLLNESGKFSSDAIEAALAHQDKDAVRRAYARGAYWDERLKLAQWWADYLDTLRRGAEIIPLSVGATR